MKKTLDYSLPVLRLMDMAEDLVPAAAIAPILGMKAETIIKKAKIGKWDRGVCNYIISGTRVKFFRVDFLRKGGWIN